MAVPFLVKGFIAHVDDKPAGDRRVSPALVDVPGDLRLGVVFIIQDAAHAAVLWLDGLFFDLFQRQAATRRAVAEAKTRPSTHLYTWTA